MTSRRRFLTIAGAAFIGSALPARAVGITQWRGVALGADASITLAHPRAEAVIADALAEIARLEAIFSLHHPASALVRLNATGRLAAPPFELLECLGLCGQVHRVTGGRFDPTIQPLWALYARHFSNATGSDLPPESARAAAVARIGWARLRMDADEIRLSPGMALTLNGVAQGYIADRVADLLRARGVGDVLVNTGELRALGGDPRGGPWQVRLRADAEVLPDMVALEDMALASSSARGIAFDAGGQIGHILDPLCGLPAAPMWSLVTVSAPRAALADALSTAFCMMDRADMAAAIGMFPGARLLRAL